MNCWIVDGTVGHTPVFKKTPNGTDVCELSIAVTDFTAGGGKETVWVSAKLYGTRAAQAFRLNIKKGTKIIIKGKARLDQWTNAAGQDKSQLCNLVDEFTVVFPPAAPIEQPIDANTGNSAEARPRQESQTRYRDDNTFDSIGESDY